MKSKMKLQKTMTTSVIKRGDDILIRKETVYPPDTTLKVPNGKMINVTWHYKTEKGIINLYNKNDSEQLEMSYMKQRGEDKWYLCVVITEEQYLKH